MRARLKQTSPTPAILGLHSVFWTARLAADSVLIAPSVPQTLWLTVLCGFQQFADVLQHPAESVSALHPDLQSIRRRVTLLVCINNSDFPETGVVQTVQNRRGWNMGNNSNNSKTDLTKRRGRIFLVDRHVLMRNAAAVWINHCSDLEVCGKTGSIAGAMRDVKRLRSGTWSFPKSCSHTTLVSSGNFTGGIPICPFSFFQSGTRRSMGRERGWPARARI